MTMESPRSIGGDLLGDRGASLSPCGRYRYTLWRRWDYSRPAVLFVMLNPSTADATEDDPTIRRCIGFARRWGAGGVRVCNLYAWRATKPRELERAAFAVGEQGGIVNNPNDNAICAAASDAGRIIAAWGAWPGPYPLRVDHAVRLLAEYRDVEALGLTKEGRPRHPLYVRGDVEPVIYRRRAREAA